MLRCGITNKMQDSLVVPRVTLKLFGFNPPPSLFRLDLLTTNFLTPPFDGISGLVTALSKVSNSRTETFTITTTVTSVQKGNIFFCEIEKQ